MSILEAQPLVGWNCPGKCHLAPMAFDPNKRWTTFPSHMSYDMTKTLAKTLAWLWGCSFARWPAGIKPPKNSRVPSLGISQGPSAGSHFVLCFATLFAALNIHLIWTRTRLGLGFVGLAEPSGSGSPSGSVKENNKNIHRYCYYKGTIGCWYMECVTDHCLRTRLLAVQGVSVLALQHAILLTLTY